MHEMNGGNVLQGQYVVVSRFLLTCNITKLILFQTCPTIPTLNFTI